MQQLSSREGIEIFVAELARRLVGKAPRLSGHGPRDAMMLFMHDDGGAPTRVRLRLTRGAVAIGDGPTEEPAVVFCAHAGTWLAHLAAPDAASDPTDTVFEIYGDHALFGEVVRLIDLPRSPLAARFFS